MEKKDILDTFIALREESAEAQKNLEALFQEVSKLIEENQAIRLENKHLRDQIQVMRDEKTSTVDQEGHKELTKSRLNLENIYEDGFHVCHMFFGQRRQGDESCAFCLDAIYGKR